MLIKWNEPLWGFGGEIIGNSIISATPEDVVRFWRFQHNGYNSLSDEEVLDEFIVVNWAWKEET